MPDREKVIRAIELEIKHENTWECREKCPYYGKTDCNCFTQVLVDALELLKEQENQLTMKYEEGFHDGYRQAMSEAVPCYECQEFSCDDCKFKDNRTVKLNAIDRR